jgi:uncharacterized protein
MSVSKAEAQAISQPREPAGRVFAYIAVTVAVVCVALAWAAHDLSGRTVIGFHLWQLVVVAVILCVSGLMSGLSGFGFSAVGSLCLIFLPPKLAVPLLMALSTANQLMSLGQIREDLPKSWADAWPAGSAPYILGGVVGVPLGVWLLNHLPAQKLMLVFGVILIAYSIYSLAKSAAHKTRGTGGAASGMAVGFIGGTVGGFTAFPGAAVVVWTGLRNLPKRVSRAIVQPYILVLQIVSLATNAYAHPATFGRRFWLLLAITLPVVLPGTIAGVALYKRISDVNFKRITFMLLGVSGVGLLVKVLLK